MPATCSLCTHPQHHQIEAALVARESQQQIADHFGLSSRKVLRTHLRHFTVLQQAVAPPPSPDPPAPTLPTVAQAQAQLQALEAQRATAGATVEQLTAQRAEVGIRLRVARLNERPARWDVEAQVAQLEQDLDAAHRQVQRLTQQIQATQRELTQARARRTHHEQHHWLSSVLPHLEDEFERYCCRLLARPHGRPPTTPAAVLQRLGPRGASELRVATCQRLRAQYPFVEEV